METDSQMDNGGRSWQPITKQLVFTKARQGLVSH
jgi:hypothetical protein